VGNPKYDCYKDLNISALQARFIEEYGLSRQDVNIGFIGQPLSQFKGYLNTFSKCSKIISEMGQNIRCFYRPHPKENEDTQYKIMRYFEQSRCKITLHKCDRPIEELFAGSDLLVTFFSTAGFDAQMLNACSDIALATTLYLKTDDRINDFYRNQNTLNEIPYSMPPFSMTVSKLDELAPALQQCLSPEAKESSHRHIKKALDQPRSSANVIVKMITRALTNDAHTLLTQN